LETEEHSRETGRGGVEPVGAGRVEDWRKTKRVENIEDKTGRYRLTG
jgi:hypothetical protein